MKPFTIYHSLTQSGLGQQEKLVSLILELIQPDRIYLLGASLYRRRSESIFCTTAPTSQHYSDYYFLILIGSTHNRPLSEWQDKIEQHCGSLMPVTVIVLETSTFNEWLSSGHQFARTVMQVSTPVFEADNIQISSTGDFDPETENIALEKQYREGLDKAREFLAGAELFRVRKQNKLAAFMLHQSAEQALRTLLKIGTGFHSCTHNIDRLIRYASMVSYQLPDVFPRKTENEKRLFSLLQKAYIDSRYKEDYIIQFQDLILLTERVNQILDLIKDSRQIVKKGQNIVP